jgi:type IV pilus assembly protein PilV
MRKQITVPPQSEQKGVVLVEAMIAILIFSIGVLGIVGMQANMVKNTAESKSRADAFYIAQEQIGMLWADSDNLPLAQLTVPVDLPNGTATITPLNGKDFQVTITWTQPGEPPHTYTTVASIVGEGAKP